MRLEDQNAVIYGGGGSIGGTVARAFAREGGKVFLAGRTLAKLEEVAEQVRSAGGVAETAHVDALDERAVDGYVDAVAERAGGIDVSFNAVRFTGYQRSETTKLTGPPLFYSRSSRRSSSIWRSTSSSARPSTVSSRALRW